MKDIQHQLPDPPRDFWTRLKHSLRGIEGNIRPILEYMTSILLALTIFALFVWHLAELLFGR